MTNEERIQSNNAELLEAIEQAENLPDAGGGDASHMVVTFTTAEDGTLTPSHTYAQITEWVNNGGSVALTNGNTWYNLAFINKSQVWFERTIVTASSSTYTRYIITSLGYMDEIETNSKNINVTAAVGQTIIVKEVDENGKPTAWEAVDTGYHYFDIVDLLPEQTLPEAGILGSNFVLGDIPLLGLIEGETYTYTFDGETYTSVATKFNSLPWGEDLLSGVMIGNFGMLDAFFGTTYGDNGQPVIFLDTLSYGVFVPAVYGVHTASINGKKEILKKLDPYVVPYTYYIDITAETVDNVITYTCADTVENVAKAYNLGRELVLRAPFNNEGTIICFARLSASANSDTGEMVFIFIGQGLYTGNSDNFVFMLTSQADGTFTVSNTVD